MEVHHHAHTPRKKLTHYFWEFLMLFLAVFCGFLAEYTLEHKIEKDREKQFIRSLANDIRSDIAQLNSVIRRRDEKIKRLDSLLYLINLPNYKEYGSNIYFNAIHTGRLVDIRFTANNGTLQQLKNAGGLRLIRHRAIVDSITHYDVSVRNIETLGQQEAERVMISGLSLNVSSIRLCLIRCLMRIMFRADLQAIRLCWILISRICRI